jgi:hypothetical protein
MHSHNKKKTFANKSDPVIRDYIEDLRAKDTEHVHIARVLKFNGDGRVEVVYCIGDKGIIAQVIIPGRFRGKAKYSSMVDVGSFLLVGETGVTGPASLEMIALISEEQMDKIKKIVDVDNRILAKEADKETIVANKVTAAAVEDIDMFDRSGTTHSVDIDDI